MAVIERWIDESDVYLLILGGRYGSIEPKSGKSYTHLEYEYAVSKNKALFAVVISEKGLNDKVSKDGRTVIESENGKELNAFRLDVQSKLVKFWDDKKDIKIAIHETLAEFSHSKPGLVGWIRGDNSVNASLLADEMARLTSENAELRNKLGSTQPNQVIPLYAGLRYEELESLFQGNDVKIELGRTVPLLTYLVENGYEFIPGYLAKPGDDFVHVLRTYKLITREFRGGNWKYYFTEDGHNFFLKALVKEKEANT